jgi:hypothetical protein
MEFRVPFRQPGINAVIAIEQEHRTLWLRVRARPGGSLITITLATAM